MTGTIEQLAAAWDQAGVRWALLRGRATLGNPSSDVDLLVHRADWDVAEGVVRRLGGAAYPRWRYPGHREFRVQGVRLDIVTELRYSRRDRVPSGLEDGCLERRVKDGWLWQLSPTDTFWTVLLHCLLDKGRFTERRAAELTATSPVLARPSDPESFTARILPAGWSPDRVVDCVRDERWSELAGLAEQLTPPSPLPPLARRAFAWARGVTAGAAMRIDGMTTRTARENKKGA